MQVVSAALEPLNGQSGILLDVLEGVIQANMPERTPKVPKGARDFGHKEMTIRKPMSQGKLRPESIPYLVTVDLRELCTQCIKSIISRRMLSHEDLSNVTAEYVAVHHGWNAVLAVLIISMGFHI